MSSISLALEQSLRSLPYLGNYSGFPLQASDWSKFVTLEQALNFSVFGLKPLTAHRVFLNPGTGEVDVTSLCKQTGRQLGDGLETPYVLPFVPNNQVGLNFTYYFRAGTAAVTEVEQAAAQAILVGGVRTLEIRSSDGTSRATVQLTIPQYAREEVEALVKKSPSSNPNQVAQNISYLEVAKAVSDKDYYFTPPTFSLIQTFYADPEIVRNAGEVTLTSIDLFFKTKPNPVASLSGNPNAGVAIAICEIDNDQPNLQKTYALSLSYKNYSQIFSFGDASAATTFGFKQPIKLATGKFYGIVVIFEDPGYVLWNNKTGDRLVNTNIPSPGVNSNKDGKLFLRNNASVFNAISDTDIKFTLRCAQFIANSDVKIFVNRNYEFFTVDNQTGSFLGGENVWQSATPLTGSINITQGSSTIVGTGTNFQSTMTVNKNIVLLSGNSSQVVTVAEISSNTVMTVFQQIEFTNNAGQYVDTVIGKVFKQDRTQNKLVIIDSTASSPSACFTAGSILIGADSEATANIASIDNLSIDRVRVRGSVRTPANGLVDVALKTTAQSGGSFTYSDANLDRVSINNLQAYNITSRDAVMLSRSNEVQEASLFSNANLFVDKKSLKIEANYTVLGDGSLYSSPLLEGSKIDLYAIKNKVSNACNIEVGGVSIDTEVAGNGIALSKHIGTKVQFSNDKFAEDVRMFMVAYRPKGTEIRAYARVYNSKDPEAFDDKAWTPLEYVQNANRFSSIDDENDFVEYELGLPQFSEAANTIPGTFTTTLNSDLIVASNSAVSALATNIANNDVIRIYNPLFPTTNYQVAVVKEANTTHIIIGDKITTTNVVGAGYIIDKVKYPNMAFNNVNNTNIARYYNSTLAEFDAFDSMQVKIVMLADTTIKVPRIDQIQVLGVSA
jgi:hypothetical protein